jgi:hypothetical protein
MKHIEARLATLEKILASPPPVRLQMGDGRIEALPVHDDEDGLAFALRILGCPLSREAEWICDAVEILQQPARLVELLQSVMEHPGDILSGAVTPDVVQLGLCTLEQYCGIEPQSVEDLEARVQAVYQDS